MLVRNISNQQPGQKQKFESKDVQIIFGITGQLCSGKEDVAKYLVDFIRCKVSPLEKTFRERDFFTSILEEAQRLNISLNILEIDEKQTQQLTDIIDESFTNVYSEDADVEVIRNALEQWTVPQLVYPIVNNFQYSILCQRNYFHLINVEGPTSVRFKKFQLKYPELIGKIDMALFTFIDDQVSNKDNFLNFCRQASKAHVYYNGHSEQILEILGKWGMQIFRQIRPAFPEYFMFIAHVVKLRSNCMKRALKFQPLQCSVGAIIVKKDRIVATGYNGTPQGMVNCFEGGCQRCNNNIAQGIDLEKCYCFHAEESVMLETGTKKSQGATLYTTLFPCYQCTKIIIGAGIKRFYYEEDYNNRSNSTNLGTIIEIEQINTKNYVH